MGPSPGPAAVAAYGVAMRLPENARYLFDSLRLVYLGTASQHFSLSRTAKIKEALEISVRWTAFVLFGCAMVATVFGREIIRLLFSAEYLASAPLLPLLLASVTLFLVNCLFGSTLVAAAKPRRVLVVNVITAVLSVGISVLLIRRFGLLGAAYSTVLTQALSAGLYLRSLTGLGAAPRPSCLWKPVVVFAALFAAYGLSPWRDALLMRGLLGALYLAGSWLLGTVRMADWTRLKQDLALSGSPAARVQP